MNEDRFGYQVRRILNAGTQNIDDRVSRRLAEARELALKHQKVAHSGLAIAGGGFHGLHMPHIHLSTRQWLAIIAILCAAIGTSVWQDMQEATYAEETADVDAALLKSDIPPNALLDKGFDTWLKRSSPD